MRSRRWQKFSDGNRAWAMWKEVKTPWSYNQPSSTRSRSVSWDWIRRTGSSMRLASGRAAWWSPGGETRDHTGSVAGQDGGRDGRYDLRCESDSGVGLGVRLKTDVNPD